MMKVSSQNNYFAKAVICAACFLFVLAPTIDILAQVSRKPIGVDEPTEPLEERFERSITLDVREMNVLDVIKFLSLKGDFNMVTTDTVEGRSTLYLKNVKIKDAWDIILLSNDLAYYVERDIVHVLTDKEYEEVFGKKFNDRMEVSIIHLDYAKPSYILAALENIKSSLGRIIIDEDTGSVVLIDTKEAIAAMTETITKMEVPVELFVYALQYAEADVVAEKLKARIDAHKVGSVTTDERSNKLIVRAQPGRRKEVEKIIKSLDTQTKEVLVEARIMQVVFKPQYDWGIDWEFNFSKNPDRHLRRLNIKSTQLTDSSPGSPLSTNFGRIAVGDIDVDQFQSFLRALKQVSDTKILSNPKILVTNNQEAKIHIGDTVPYIISTTSGTGDNAITSEDVRFVDVGIKLNVTPTINDDGYVSMLLKPEISTVVGQISSQGGGIPQVNKTEVETSVLVKDGETIILGGLKKQNKIHVEQGVPFLMDIPILGKMFRNANDESERTETVIFITPHIISGEGAMAAYRGEIKPPKSNVGEIKYKEVIKDSLTIKD